MLALTFIRELLFVRICVSSSYCTCKIRCFWNGVGAGAKELGIRVSKIGRKILVLFRLFNEMLIVYATFWPQIRNEAYGIGPAIFDYK